MIDIFEYLHQEIVESEFFTEQLLEEEKLWEELFLQESN
jgi:hypothetical protein